MDAMIGALLAGLAGGLFVGGTVWLLGRQQHAAAAAARRAGEERFAELSNRFLEQKTRSSQLERQLEQKNRELTLVHGDKMALQARLKGLEERLAEAGRVAREKQELLLAARQELTDAFKAVSSDIFRSNSHSFLALAKETMARFQERARGDLEKRQDSIGEMVNPIRSSLEKVDVQLRQLEKERAEAYVGLREQVKSLARSQQQLQGETANLVKALRTPTVRGRWGEIQLRRVVELAGMVEYCDFVQQPSASNDHGQLLRPDMIIRLPAGKNIIVDSKAPLQAYLEAMEAVDDELRQVSLREHARQVRTHIGNLSAKGYWDQFQDSPEFVVLFLPGENFFSAALEHDPQLIELGVNQRVILATPTTLIALLRAVSYGWRQERIAEHAAQIGELGKSLYERLVTMAGHFGDMRRCLDKTVESYNRAVGSFESRVLVTARKFKEIDPSLSREIGPLDRVERAARLVQLEEATAGEQGGSDGEDI